MKNLSEKELPKEASDVYQDTISLFAGVMEHIKLQYFAPGEQIVRAHAPLEQLYFLLSGRGKISLVHEDGKRSIVHFVSPREFIGELSLIDIESSPKDVTAILPSYCLVLSIDKVKSILLKDPGFLLVLSQYIGGKLLARTWFHAKQQAYSLKYRLAAYLLLSSCQGYYEEKHTETAEFLGVSYRHLLHTFEAFKEEGLLQKKGRGFTLDLEGLQELANRLQ